MSIKLLFIEGQEAESESKHFVNLTSPQILLVCNTSIQYFYRISKKSA
jgi:hypothetical protein